MRSLAVLSVGLFLLSCAGSDATTEDLSASQGGAGGQSGSGGKGGSSGKGGAGKGGASGSSGQSTGGQPGAGSGGAGGAVAGAGGGGAGGAGAGAGGVSQGGSAGEPGAGGQGATGGQSEGGAAGAASGASGQGGSVSGASGQGGSVSGASGQGGATSGSAGQGESGASGQSGAGGEAGQGGAGGAAVTPVRFVALGDTGEGSDDQKAVAAAMVKKCAESGCDFALMLGDNFYDTGVSSVDDPQWKTKFEDVYQDLDIPFYAVLGNHDYGTDGAGLDPSKAQVQVDYAKISSKWKMPAKHYHFTSANAEFFALDTNQQLLLQAGDQKKAVAQWIASSVATWKIALGHHPILSNGPHGNAGTYEGIPFIPIISGGGVKDFMEDVVCGQIDLYLCGHDHSRQYLKDTCKGTELVVSGAGAKASKLDQKNAYHFQALTTGFLYVRIEGNTLTSEFIDENGQVEFTRVLTK